MTKNWIKDNKIEISIIVVLLLCLAIGFMSYTLFGHQVIKAMYEETSIGLLNSIIDGQASFSVEYYYEITDVLFRNFSIFFIVCIIGFLICEHIGGNKITGSFLYLIIFITSFPAIGRVIDISLDPSWLYALNYFFFKNMQFGKDIMFTYGPLGFLKGPQPVGNNLLVGICFYFATYMILVYSIVCLIMSIHREKRALAMVMYTFLVFYILARFEASLYYLSVLLVPTLILNYDNSKRPFFMHITAAVISTLFLIKIGWGIVGLLFLGSYLTRKLLLEKKYRLFLWPIITGAIVFFTLWFCIYNDFSGITNYIFSGFQFIYGNASAMSLDPGNDLSVIHFLSVLIIMMFFMFYAKDKKIYLINSIFLLPSIAMFKYAFGRQDRGHIKVFTDFLLVYFFVIIIQKLSVRKKMIFSILFCILLLMFFRLNGTPGLSTFMVFNGGLGKGIKNLYNASFGYKAYRENLTHDSEIRLKKEILSKEILKEIKQYPTDIYPWNTTYIPANNLNWRPRPVFQSYVAYTPWLDEADNDFVTSKDAPVYIIWVTKRWGGAVGSVDGRYLFNDEPKTIYEIINNYEPILFEEKAVLLKRKEIPTFCESVELHGEKCRWDEWINIPVPKNNVIRAKIEFARTLYGKIKRLLWKEKEVFIEYKFKKGKIKKHRLVVDNAISGVWIHPYITDVSSVLKDTVVMHEMEEDENNNLFFGNTVIQIRLSYKDKNTFEPYFSIVWEEIRINR